MPNVNPAGNIKKVDITGCQTKPEQFKISKDEHGSMYLLTIASAIWRLLGEYLYQIWPIWVYPTSPFTCNKTSKYILRIDIANKIKPKVINILPILYYFLIWLT